ncbi:hypothetical protein OHB41_48000 [Streptomyces sp. NBC_01571]|uniref:hypothetical protein n=1 Tax=Streptomyces sp. NBC_01571 TaxID=2975883 RepID=UPI00225A9502|nr:hypothetical protein [Streptomyces sp. NBC_01571]MCX4580733.1 hypothetical protein [Streptomyces sp. NBC_01571]
MAAELPLKDIRLGALVSRRSQLFLTPPLSAPEVLPFGELSPPVFERVVGEVMWLVDGMNDIRGYGRSGQDQGGLDLIGRRKGQTHVYQVRRIVSLSASALRTAVTDFTGPPRTTTPDEGWSERRFDAARFVLTTGCVVDDTAVEDELVALQETYRGDIGIELYDAYSLSRFLRERPYLVAGVFGPEWAKAFCGVETPPVPTLPHGYTLLNDPLEHLGLADALHRAQQLAETEPGPAAELFGDLALELEQASFTGHADQLRTRQRDLLASAGQADAAFTVAATLILDRYDTGDHMFVDQHLERLASDAGGTASKIYVALKALGDWFEYGYNLAPVTTALVAVVQAGDPLAARLVLAVIEQIVADEHPDDHTAGWLIWLPRLSPLRQGFCGFGWSAVWRTWPYEPDRAQKRPMPTLTGALWAAAYRNALRSWCTCAAAAPWPLQTTEARPSRSTGALCWPLPERAWEVTPGTPCGPFPFCPTNTTPDSGKRPRPCSRPARSAPRAHGSSAFPSTRPSARWKPWSTTDCRTPCGPRTSGCGRTGSPVR